VLDPEVHRIIEAVEGSVGPVDSARSLPAEAYTSEAFFAFEVEAIFRRSWLFLCHVSEVPEVGSCLSVWVTGEPLLVVRGADGEVRVMSGVCQHRGYALLADGEATTVRHLRCAYHSWSYALDGRLEGAPSMAPAHDLDALKATICLPQLRVEVWQGMVFASFDADVATLAPTLVDVEPEVAAYRFADLRVVDTLTLTDLPFNWKNMQENALEEYHTTYVHRGYHENAPAHLVRHPEYEQGDGAVWRSAGLVQRAGEPLPNFPLFPVMEGLDEHCYRTLLFEAVLPAQFAAIEAMGVKMFRILPQSATRTTLTISWLYPEETIARPDFAELMVGQMALVDGIDRPDLESNRRMHAGLRSVFAPRGPYSPQEASLPQMNEWLLERYRAAAGRHA